MKIKRKIIEINEDLCNGCGKCVRACAEGAIQMVNDKARLVSDVYCDGLGACIGDCPTGALKVVEREAEAFDEAAVDRHLAKKQAAPGPGGGCPSQAGGCPSMQHKTFARSHAPQSTTQGSEESSLGHWPVQIRLIGAQAPYLDGAHVVVAADCVPVAYPSFQRDFVAGKVVMIGCPKFDDTDLYIDRFVDIFCNANIQSVTVVVMEVPCCQGLPMVVQQAREIAGVVVPIEKVVVGRDGGIISRQLVV